MQLKKVQQRSNFNELWQDICFCSVEPLALYILFNYINTMFSIIRVCRKYLLPIPAAAALFTIVCATPFLSSCSQKRTKTEQNDGTVRITATFYPLYIMVSRSSRQYIFLSIIISFASGIAGLALSYYIGAASGATIVLVNAILFGVCFILSLMKKN